jgi:hypothetical protein
MKFYSEIYKAFIIAGIISFIISMATTGKVSYGGQVAGYSSLVVGIMLILLVLFYNLMNANPDSKNAVSILSIIMTTGPFFMMFAIIGFILYLLIENKDIIINDHVAPKYKTFRNIAQVLLVLQMIIVMNKLNSESFKTTGKIGGLTSSLMYLFSVFTLACSLILYVILTYYTTDG